MSSPVSAKSRAELEGQLKDYRRRLELLKADALRLSGLRDQSNNLLAQAAIYTGIRDVEQKLAGSR